MRAEDGENDYLVSVGRETGVLHSWCVPAPNLFILHVVYLTGTALDMLPRDSQAGKCGAWSKSCPRVQTPIPKLCMLFTKESFQAFTPDGTSYAFFIKSPI